MGERTNSPTLYWSVASFPGSPCARTKNGKERGQPGKIYHVRNVIGRENLITCGRTNELAHALLTIYSFSRESFMADRTGLDSTVTLPGSTARCGERTQTRTFETHANLLAYLTNWSLYTPKNGFRGVIKRQGGPFLSYAQAFSVLIVRINCQNGVPMHGPTEARLRLLSITQLRACAHRRSAYAQLCPLPSLYPLRHSW